MESSLVWSRTCLSNCTSAHLWFYLALVTFSVSFILFHSCPHLYASIILFSMLLELLLQIGCLAVWCSESKFAIFAAHFFQFKIVPESIIFPDNRCCVFLFLPQVQCWLLVSICVGHSALQTCCTHILTHTNTDQLIGLTKQTPNNLRRVYNTNRHLNPH